jgi:cephalosporin-C deacetylase-like acetyl esterase
MRRRTAAIVASIVCVGALPLWTLRGREPLSAAAAAAGPFDYDRQAPLDLRESSAERSGDVSVRDVTYASPKGGRVPAWLVVPRGKGPFAGIVFQHWGLGDRGELLPEAVLLARAGAVSLLVEAPWARPAPWTHEGEGHLSKPEIDADLFVQTVVDLRRAVDVLAARPDVDARRIGYVGHSFGATWGGPLAGVEHRIKASVLMAGLPSITDFSPSGAPLFDQIVQQVNKQFSKEKISHYVEVVSPLDPIRWVGRAAPSAVFMQYADLDLYIGKRAAESYFAAASEPKREAWYRGGHELNDLRALGDRDEWLRRELALAPVLPLLEAAIRRPAPPAVPPPATPAASAAATAAAAPAAAAREPIPAFEELARRLQYDPAAPLDVQMSAAGGAEVRGLTYASPRGGRVPALLVVPAGKGPFAGVVFQHHGKGDRAEFLPEALLLARAGAVSVLIDAPWARPEPWTRAGGMDKPEEQLAGNAQDVVDLRRAVDLLLARADVDPRRIAFVGHGYGATLGGVLAGVEHRIRAYVLMAGSGSYSADLSVIRNTPAGALLLAGVPEAKIDAYARVLAPLDANHYLGRASPNAAFLFQAARYDPFTPPAAARSYYDAAPGAKTLEWYDASDELMDPAALASRDRWLEKQLSLGGVLPLLEERLAAGTKGR